MITFISEYHRVPWQDALKIFRDYENYERILPEDLATEIYERLNKPEVLDRGHKFVHPLPEEFILIEDARGSKGQKAYDYIRSRGISAKMAEKYYIGYCAEGKYANRIIMPDFENGELVYWQARTWLPTPTDVVKKKLIRKVLNPSLTESQITAGIKAMDKSEIVGNIDLVLENRMAVLCEGKMDQYTIGDTGACFHGKHMSDTQFVKLVTNKKNIDVVSIMLDGDAMKNAISTAERLYKHFDDILICKLPKDKDPNSLGTKGCLELLNDSLAYSPMFGVKAKLKGWL